jgi:hypothetical protein
MVEYTKRVRQKERTILNLIAKDLKISNCDSLVAMNGENQHLDRTEAKNQIMNIFVDNETEKHRKKNFQKLFITPYDFRHHHALFLDDGCYKVP